MASTIKEGLHSNEIVAEQMRRSLQGEAKSKVVGFGADTTMEDMLPQLDQFYMDQFDRKEKQCYHSCFANS